MFEFIAGVVTGGFLFGGKKESDAEYHAKLAREDRKRASATLNKDLSYLPAIIEGEVSKVEKITDLNLWAYPYQVLTVNGWNIALDDKLEVPIGTAIRVVNNSKVRIDGIWHDLVMRVSNTRLIANRSFGLVRLFLSGYAMWALWRTLEILWSAMTSFMSKDGYSYDQEGMIYWGVSMFGALILSAAIDAIPKGRPSTWKLYHD